MADKLTIRITVEGDNQTVSKFVAPDKGKIAFHNDSGTKAEVKFEGASPVCVGNDPQPILIIESMQQKEFKVCNNTTGNSYKYTATVDGALPEDPILIIERAPIIWVEMAGPVLFGLACGVVAGYLIAMRRKMRSQ
jgi:hypothetical protein